MTLAEAIARLATRFGVDLDAEIDTTSNDAMTDALMVAARKVSRDSYFLWTYRSNLTLTNNDPDYDTLGTVSAEKVFHVYGVHINGNWLFYHEPSKFVENFPTYFSASSSATPADYTLHTPSIIRLAVPPNATAAAASDNFVIGFRLHTTYTYASNQNTELEGPEEFHELIIDRAALDISVSYVAGQEGYARRQMVEERYQRAVSEYKAHNLSLYKPSRRSGQGVGSTRRIHSIGSRT